MGEKTRNGNTWTEAQYVGFIKSALRGARWGPKYQCIKDAKVGYAQYRCALCGVIGGPTLPPPEGKKNRIKNAVADHIEPVVDPSKGFQGWDEFISRLYVEKEGFQCLCHKCHTEKSAEENLIRKDTRSNRVLYPREESSYRNMMSRCFNSKATGYEYYGGRGITVCNDWIESFQNFYRDMGARPEGTSLDRIDTDGHYSPENCRWATNKEQARNKTYQHYISIGGISKTVSEWAEECDILPNTLLYRIRRGWTPEEALGFIERQAPHLSRISVDTWAEIQSLRDEGYTTTELSEMFDMDPSQISRKTTRKLLKQEEDE